MAKIAAWEFEGDGVFDGHSMYAEVAPRQCRALVDGTIEFTFTCDDITESVVVANGVPEIHSGAFEVTVTAEGAVALACSNGGIDPVRAATPSGFAVEGERIQVTLSWGERRQFTVVNVSRLEDDPETLGAGFAAALPLWARIRVSPGAPLTFGAAHRGNPPYFHGIIHRVSLTDTCDRPSISPPSATVHDFETHRRGPVRPRRVAPAAMSRGAGQKQGGMPSGQGILVTTAEGEKPVGEVAEGEEILTRDHGFQPVRWVGHAVLDWSALRRRPHLRPVVIRRGGLGQGLPETDLVVPPHQRLVSQQGDHEVLLNARTLIGTRGVFEAEAIGLRYTHFQFDRSELIQLNGVWVEAFNPADALIGGPFAAQRQELYELFPALRVVVFGQKGPNADQS